MRYGKGYRFDGTEHHPVLLRTETDDGAEIVVLDGRHDLKIYLRHYPCGHRWEYAYSHHTDGRGRPRPIEDMGDGPAECPMCPSAAAQAATNRAALAAQAVLPATSSPWLWGPRLRGGGGGVVSSPVDTVRAGAEVEA